MSEDRGDVGRPAAGAPVEVARFDPGRGARVESRPPSAPALVSTESLRVMTMNVWFGDLHWERRCDAILSRKVFPRLADAPACAST